MSKHIAFTKLAGTLCLGLLVTSCARFKERTQADGKYDYEKVTLRDSAYDSGDFTRHEERSVYEISQLTEQQAEIGLAGKEVDIRPPGQLMPVIDGVLIDANPDNTQISFNAFKDDEKLTDKVWDLLLQYLADKGANQVVSDKSTLIINTGPVTRKQTYGSLSKNHVEDTADYQLTLKESRDKRSILLMVDVKHHEQLNDNRKVNETLIGRNKQSIETRFINDLLAFAYHQQVANAQQVQDNKPLPIKLGFDNNHQTAWIIDSDFTDTWLKLPSLLQLMSFEAVQDNKNLGYFLVKFEPKDDKYWIDNGLNKIDLPSGEYFVQLGELTGGATSILWLDSDKKPLTEQQVTDLYLSITDKVRSVILDKEDKLKPL